MSKKYCLPTILSRAMRSPKYSAWLKSEHTVDLVARHIIDSQSTTGASQGVIAYAAANDYASLDDLLAASAEKNEPPLYVILDGI